MSSLMNQKNVRSELITYANDTKLRWGTTTMNTEKQCKDSKLKIGAEREKGLWDQHEQTAILYKT